MATIESIDPLAPVITPFMVLDYGYQRGSQSVVHDLLGSEYPHVALRPARSRNGTLSLLFQGRAAAVEAEGVLRAPASFHFLADETADGAYAGEDFHFVRTGNVTVTKVTSTTYWTVTVDFREIQP